MSRSHSSKAQPATGSAMTMRRALSDPALLGRVLEGDSWRAWRILLIASMGEALTNNERAIFNQLTGRPQEPGERLEELWAVVGRRGVWTGGTIGPFYRQMSPILKGKTLPQRVSP